MLFKFRYISLILCLCMTLSNVANAEKIKQIRVDGAQRIEPQTIVSYMGIEAGDEFSQENLNIGLKQLFGTGLFSDISLYKEQSTLVVKLIENPIINRIAFEGNKKIKDDALLSEIKLRPRVVLTRGKIQTDVDRLLSIYRLTGKFSATIEPKIIRLDQNRVNLVFEVSEGPLTKIQRINFVGNKRYDDARLQKVITSKEDRWYRFLSTSDNYDPERLGFDKELLRRYYLEHGYADFRIDSANAELTSDKSRFFLTFNVSEGERYRVNKVEIQSEVLDLKTESLYPDLEIKAGDWYNSKKVEDSVIALTSEAGNKQYAFIDIKPGIKRNRDEKTIDINFIIKESAKVFVDKININGNVRTLDRVIRREMQLVEGDPYNRSKLRESEKNIRNLDFFERVNLKPRQGNTPDTSIVDIEVAEKSTGDLSIGGGFSTSDGVLGNFRIRERNLLGKGQDLSFSTTLSGSRSQFDLSFTEPYFLGKKISAGFDLFHIDRDLQDESSYDRRQTGGALRMGYPIAKNWSHDLAYSYDNTTIENVQSDASTFILQQEGTRKTSAVSHSLKFDTRDSKLNTTEGTFVTLRNEFAGLGGEARYYNSKLTLIQYYTLYDEWILKGLLEGGYVFGWGDENVEINERFFIGGNTLRGFERSGIGPRDSATEDALGGNEYARGSFELSMPSGLPEELGIKLHTFTDFGYLTGIDDKGANIQDDRSLRLTVGGGFSWESPFGPIKLDFSAPIKKEDYDLTESFRFNFGTNF